MNRVVFSEEAVRLFRGLEKDQQRAIKNGIRVHLAENDPSATSRNKFRLRRPSPHAEYELRLGELRVFYRIRNEAVEIVLIGEKCGSRLLIGNKEFEL